MCGPRRRIIFGKRREVAIKDESDKALKMTKKQPLTSLWPPWASEDAQKILQTWSLTQRSPPIEFPSQKVLY